MLSPQNAAVRLPPVATSVLQPLIFSDVIFFSGLSDVLFAGETTQFSACAEPWRSHPCANVPVPASPEQQPALHGWWV